MFLCRCSDIFDLNSVAALNWQLFVDKVQSTLVHVAEDLFHSFTACFEFKCFLSFLVLRGVLELSQTPSKSLYEFILIFLKVATYPASSCFSTGREKPLLAG